jgi:hypothetical protein
MLDENDAYERTFSLYQVLKSSLQMLKYAFFCQGLKTGLQSGKLSKIMEMPRSVCLL